LFGGWPRGKSRWGVAVAVAVAVEVEVVYGLWILDFGFWIMEFSL
jgi:hypothetical protein